MMFASSLAFFWNVFLLLSFNSAASASPMNAIGKRANESYVGYLMIHFYDRQAAVFGHLSVGNDPLAWTPLNNDRAIIVPTMGTTGARDPYLISAPDDSKHWIVATDLDIDSTNWGDAVSRGSRSIYVWESTDLINWGNERLVELVPPTAGMVWAPEAIYAGNGQYLVHWASRFYNAADTGHTGSSTLNQIWYAMTSDFVTFTEARPYIAINNTPVIDLTILPLGPEGEYVRFIKNETVLLVWEEHTTGGLFGEWTRVNRPGTYLDNVVSEGPLVFWDNEIEGRVHVFLDQYTTARGYVPWQTDNILSGRFTQSPRNGFPALLKHGVVKPLSQAQYDLISERLA